MSLDPAQCYRALTSRDARFDGRFFVGVRTTGIYCRPVCPARTPLLRNIDFYPTAAAASEAGFRPCRRCRPEASPGTPAWQGTSATVTRALRLVTEGALDADDVETLAQRLGIGERHLRRLFRQHLGASPVAVAQTRRLHFAKKLIDETTLPMTEVALASGYGSVRRFNAAVRGAYGIAPSALRRAKPRRRPTVQRDGSADLGWLTLRLPHRTPIASPALLEFLAARAIPGVECVAGSVYRRALEIDGVAIRMEVHTDREPEAFWLRVSAEAAPVLTRVVDAARRLFDLDADPQAIADTLAGDALLGPTWRREPGLRVPGATDAHELAVRAILGQQVSVAGARTLAGRLAARFGRALSDRCDGDALTHTFPTAAALAEADVASIGLPTRRAEAIRALARSIAGGDLCLAPGCDPDAVREQLLSLPGVGPWTADYIAMRALREPDAFPSNDLVLRKRAGGDGQPLTERALIARAEDWRPWRAYAAIALWRSAKAA